jgi:hypothetical protein
VPAQETFLYYDSSTAYGSRSFSFFDLRFSPRMQAAATAYAVTPPQARAAKKIRTPIEDLEPFDGIVSYG